ncbi:unnamed protein product [Colletotrichum noveboracense]|uniref:Uncharacterized protein n=1 Tax=Colletotrichum noveboracense TaxID=2664923 RepID=A0A9W4RWE5_9PEZI|nr:hypothetical protein K456DRAFT_1727358 [Colletotrichum gloeosporioides 23]KAJ0274206.1 hypothetical protein COL940_009456 [Colletotrichum noveboracense]KAJ0286805.1 hypothetical protein CBS470a_005684 [Colletotrichum nupharicola]CAI0647929.1 unnamed protein product [Colletotrichum noveboracense]
MDKNSSLSQSLRKWPVHPPKWPLQSPLSQSFKRFLQLPPEIQQMIWIEFYRIPRYFTVEWHSYFRDEDNDDGGRKDDDDKDDDKVRDRVGFDGEENYDNEDDSVTGDNSMIFESRNYVWFSGSIVEPISKSKAIHYHEIDNTINQMSISIAQGARSRLQLRLWCKPSGDQDGYWTNMSSHWKNPEDPFVNFELDFLYFHKIWAWPPWYSREEKKCLEWMGNIQNIIINTEINRKARSEDEVRCTIAKGFTKENLWLWKMRRYLPNLKVIRRVLADGTPQVLNEWAYFQTRYLLREAHNEQWRNTRQEIATEPHWLPAMCSPKEPEWRPFLNRLLHCDITIRGAVPQDLTPEDDEILGSRKLFGGFLRTLVDADAEER